MSPTELAADPLLRNVPPHSLEAERAVLGAVLIDPRAVDDVAEILGSSDPFYSPQLAQIFDVVLELWKEDRPIDVVLLNEELSKRGTLESVGGTAALAELCEVVPTSANAAYYAKIVADRAMQRRLIEVAARVQKDAFETGGSVEELMDRSEQSLFEVTQQRIRNEAVAVGSVVQEAYAQLVAREQGQGVVGLPSGFADLDELTAGFQPGEMTILAARPSMGKCLAHDAEVVLSDGSVRTMEEIFQEQDAELLTLGDDMRLKPTRPSMYVDDGVKPVFRVTTRLGRQVETTLTHPFLRLDGWRRLSELATGDRIAVPRRIPVFGTAAASRQEIERLVDEARDYEVPPEAFRLAKASLGRFLAKLLSSGGWVTVLKTGQVQAGFATISERLARQVQHLLLRFGVIASLKQRAQPRAHWQLDVTHRESLEAFLSDVGITNREDAIARARVALSNRRPRRNRDLVPVDVWRDVAAAKGDEPWTSLGRRAGIRGHSNLHVGRRAVSRQRLALLAAALADPKLDSLARSDVYWDEIVSIEHVGQKQVYDLTIPETHNFVANDVCVHNTSFALNMLKHIAIYHGASCCFFSLEMPRLQVTSNMLCGIAKLDGHRMRGGFLTREEKRNFLNACEMLEPANMFIDDSPQLSTMELRAKGRRLKMQHNVEIIMIDYMQLMTGSGKSAKESRQIEVSEISRNVKALARELEIPIICLAQLSRKVEERKDKRPMMSDLRESGCLTGDTNVTLADTGQRVPIRELAGQSGFAVWALNPKTYKLERALVSKAFTTGVKPVVRLTTRLGRTIRATANHKFFTIEGWKRLDELSEGTRIALPRELPSAAEQSLPDAELALLAHLIGDGCTLPRRSIQYTTREEDLATEVMGLATEIFGDEVRPHFKLERTWFQVYLPTTRAITHGVRNPVSEWLEKHGCWGKRSYEKRVPPTVFTQPAPAIAKFLRHLWSTDGCVRMRGGKKPYPAIYYATSSEGLAHDVQSLLLRVAINARVKRIPQGEKGRDQFHVVLGGRSEMLRFVEVVGAVGRYKTASLAEVHAFFSERSENTNRDVIPSTIWSSLVRPSMQAAGLTHHALHDQLGMAYSGMTIFKQNVSRQRAERVAEIVGSDHLATLARSDVYWDTIAELQPEGTEPVYDLTVPGLHNFVADDIVVHNSIEQDADKIMLLHRPEYYEPDKPEFHNKAYVIVAKNRNGPTGEAELTFVKNQMRFESATRM